MNDIHLSKKHICDLSHKHIKDTKKKKKWIHPFKRSNTSTSLRISSTLMISDTNQRCY